MFKERNQSFDLLRIISCIGVVIIHVNNKFLYSTVPSSITFSILNIIGSLFRFSVLTFIMISGSYFLDNSKELTYKKLFKKYIFRILLSLVIFNTIYILYYYFIVNGGSNIVEAITLSFKRTIRGDPSGGRLWCLYLCLSLYLFTPMLRIFTKNSRKKDVEYFVVVGAIFTIVIPTITNYWKFKELKFIDYSASQMGTVFSFGYVFYYVLGYYMKKYMKKGTIKPKMRKLIYIFGIIGILTTIFLGNIISYLKNSVDLSRVYWYFSINVCVVAVAIFEMFNVETPHYSENASKVINYFTKRTFGIYLVHPLVIVILLPYFNIFHPIIASPLYSIIVFIISLLVVEILNKIPFVKKYILCN